MKNHYKFWIVLSLIIVFAAGVLGGVLLEQQLAHSKIKKKMEKRGPVRFPTLEMMAEELSLTSEQQEKIREIFRNTEERMKELNSSFRKQFSNLRSELKNDIKSVLSEEQAQKFEAMIERYLSQRKKEMEERKKHPRDHRNDKGERR
jgi:Spy/CpxP family protein refolding chaperone